jgi:hypothetical protein
VAWEGGPPRIEDFLEEACDEERPLLLRKLVEVDLRFRRRRGEAPRPEDYQQRFPLLDAEALAGIFPVSSAPTDPVTVPSGATRAGAGGGPDGLVARSTLLPSLPPTGLTEPRGTPRDRVPGVRELIPG